MAQFKKEMTEAIHQISTPLTNSKDLDPLIKRIGDSKIVCLGEASHGTHEYYTWRTAISKRLIEEKGFNFIAVEGDWPDSYRINRFVKGYDVTSESAIEVLKQHSRWPTWMWANWEVAALSEWLKKYNANLDKKDKVGFYGLDVYSLWESMDAIISYLREKDPDAMEAAINAYECFEPYSEDQGQSYARATQFVPVSCRQEVINLLIEIRKNMEVPPSDDEATFNARQNALVMVNAENYYRTMIQSSAESWNIRDHHMVETLANILEYYGAGAKAIVWEHNTHIGDARATNMSRRGMVNVGQLAREQYGQENVTLVGFGSFEGAVIAGNSWGAAMRIMQVPQAQEGSWEYLLHQLGAKNRLLLFDGLQELQYPIEHRAIGVVYNPNQERFGNYVPSVMSKRYDAFLYLDRTQELNPFHLRPDSSKMPETYPFNF